MSVTATVKWFDGKKGYGFATPETGGDDIFVHQLNIPKDADGRAPFIDEGDVIYYDIGDHNGRQTAINVSFPPDRPVKPRRRQRGRNAKKADEEGEDVEMAPSSADATDDAGDGTQKSNKDVDAPSRGKGGGRGRGRGRGRGDTSRPRRNDKGLGGEGPKKNSGPSTRGDKTADGRSAASSGAADVDGATSVS